MSNRKITINAILNVVKTGLSILFPLITYPYAARILGKENIGMTSYVSSIISYFVLISSFGINNYATREGAKIRYDRAKIQNLFEEMLGINLVCMALSYTGLAVMLLVSREMRRYMLLVLILGSEIFFKTLSVEWINNVYEDFAYITVRSIITHVVSLAVLFLIVKKPEDIYLYAFMLVLTNGINCLMNLVYCRKYVRFRICFHIPWTQHISSLFFFFVNEVTISIYVNMDMTMLGYYKGNAETGVYTIAVKIYTVIKKLLASIYIVAVPQLAEYVGKGKDEEYKRLYTQIWAVLSVLLIPAATGLSTLSEELALFMGGEEYREAAGSLQLLALGLIFAIYGGLVTACFNVTQKLERVNMYATLCGAGINVILNLILIPQYGQYGAAFTTLLAELCVLIIAFVNIKDKSRYLDLEYIGKEIRNAIIGSIIIWGIAGVIHKMVPIGWKSFIMILVESIMSYSLSLMILRDDIVRTIYYKISGNRE